jgi:hypothetical protein
MEHDFYFIFQLAVVVYDSMYPIDRVTGTVTFTVNRNPSEPLCSQSLFSANPPENAALGYVVTDVNATDQDGVSINSLFQYF